MKISHHKNHETNRNRHFSKGFPELFKIFFEWSLYAFFIFENIGNVPNFCRKSNIYDHANSTTCRHHCRHKCHIFLIANSGFWIRKNFIGFFFGWYRFSCERRFLNLQFLAFNQANICRHNSPSIQQNNITNRHFFGRNFERFPITTHNCLWRRHISQNLNRLSSAIFLRNAQHRVNDNHKRNNRRVNIFLMSNRENNRRKQNINEPIIQLRKKHHHNRFSFFLWKFIFSVLLVTLGNFRIRKALFGCYTQIFEHIRNFLRKSMHIFKKDTTNISDFF